MILSPGSDQSLAPFCQDSSGIVVWSKPCSLLSGLQRHHRFFPLLPVWPYGHFPLVMPNAPRRNLAISCSGCATSSSGPFALLAWLPALPGRAAAILLTGYPPGPLRIPGTKQTLTKILWNAAHRHKPRPVLFVLNSCVLPQKSQTTPFTDAKSNDKYLMDPVQGKAFQTLQNFTTRLLSLL